MSALTSALDSPEAISLAWTLLHFVWQGAILASVFVVVSTLGRLAPAGRHTAGVLTLAAMLVAPITTFLVVQRGVHGASTAATVRVDTASMTPLDNGVQLGVPGVREGRPSTTVRWSMAGAVVGLWAVGVCVFAIRLGGGWIVARRLVRRRLQAVNPEVQSLAIRVSGRLGLDRMVRVAQSSAVAVPVMIGWLKPVVLFPAAVLSGLTPTQIEALLAHELAHVKRHDYVVNVLQSVVETLLFYHPAVWWVSRRVRIEREHCCDDLAIGVCDRLEYVTALAELAVLSAPPRPALAATDGALLERVRRIVEAPDRIRGGGSGWLPAVALLMLGACAVPAVLASNGSPNSAAPASSAAGVAPGAATAGQEHATGAVAGGIAGGVVGGVPAGVAGGVLAGVVGSVQGGVAGTVPAPISGDAVGGANDSTPQVEIQAQNANERQQRELAARLEAAQRSAQQRIEEVQKALQTLERERIDSRFKLQLDQMAAELRALNTQQDTVKQKVDMGLLNPAELAAIQGRMAALQREIVAAQNERTVQQKEVEFRLAEARHQAELARAMDEYASIERQYAAVIDATGRQALLRDTVEMSQDERIRAGDVLVIEIGNEPDLPRAYAVREDGTIKLPLSAPLRVEGLTARAVQQDLVKQLTSRGLEPPSVEVKLRRHQSPDRR